MKKMLLNSMALLLTLCALSLHAQTEKCGTTRLLDQRIQNDPSLVLKMQQSELATQKWIATHPAANASNMPQIITIPVVVHVLWHDAFENISDAQVQSQINILNKDFRKMNTDTLPSTHPFWSSTADSQIEFCLASRDTSGNFTTGITRKYTDTIKFSGNGDEKFAATGGTNNWDPTKYMNIWVCNLDTARGTLGYATFSSNLADYPGSDGVVIHHQAFGSIGTAGTGGFDDNNLGRTGSHEVGHWLNLKHIWGDATCGDDLVADTKPAVGKNENCPAFPQRPNNACGSNADGEMYMNYMDYVDDACMNMFTVGQAARMLADLNGIRASIRTSQACQGPTASNEVSLQNAIEIYPNPSNGIFTIGVNGLKAANTSVGVYDLLGSLVRFEDVKSFPLQMNLNQLPKGVYFVRINNGGKIASKKVVITK